MTELDKLEAAPDWASLQRLGDRVGFFFGATEDIWAPPHHLEEIRRQAPSVRAIIEVRLSVQRRQRCTDSAET